MHERDQHQLLEERRDLEIYLLRMRMEDERRANEAAEIEERFAPPKKLEEGKSVEQSGEYWLTGKDVLLIAVLLIVAVFFFCIPWM